MRIQDLGGLEGPVLLFGGPYSNLQATEAIFEAAHNRGVRHMICTGDVVAYCANPAETVAMIRDSDCHVVAGNCEKQLAAGAMDCGCGFADGSTCERLSAAWYAHVDAHIGVEDRAWMAGLPDMVTFTHETRRYAVIHGGVSDVSRFLWPTSEREEFRDEINLIREHVHDVNFVIAGHCGIAYSRLIDAMPWVNAGAIGMPAHDGTQVLRYLLLREGRASLWEEPYDHKAAHAAMVAAGLTQGYHEALLTGYWPSEDVLPPDLRRDALDKWSLDNG
ncbi:MAG: metallophosphoesterase family protein [Pseudomonadota bacterium]